MPVAVVARLILGSVLILVAPDTRFPLLFQVIGWLAVVGAIALLVIGKERIGRLIGWLLERSDVLIRVWLVFGLAFAAFLIYGVRPA